MDFALSPEARAAGFGLHVFASAPSTSAEALRVARAGDARPAWFVTGHQTQGRGRRGNVWQTAPGNLAATLLLPAAQPPAILAQLGFVAGCALAHALDRLFDRGAEDDGPAQPRPRFALKWPNDALGDGAKLSGILLGTETLPDGRRVVTVGIGVNVVSAPEGLPYPAASLSGLGLVTNAAALFEALSGAMAELLGVWADGAGFDAIRKLWLARAAGLGSDVSVSLDGVVVRGVFETIDAHGQLVIRQPDATRRTISAGEVHFGPAASARPEIRG